MDVVRCAGNFNNRSRGGVQLQSVSFDMFDTNRSKSDTDETYNLF